MTRNGESKVKRFYDKKEDIPKGLEEHYVERNGRWELNVDGMVPQEDLDAEKRKVDEFRSNNVSLQDKLKDLEGKKYLTTEEQEEYENLKKQDQELKDKDLIDAGKIDEVVAQRTERMKNQYENQITALTTRAEKAEAAEKNYKGRLSSVLVEAEVGRTLSNLGIQPVKGALKDIVARAGGVWQVNEDGELVALDGKGAAIYGSEANKLLTMGEWAATTAKEAPYLFMKSEGSGGDGGKGQRGDDGQVTISASDKAAFGKNIEDIASGKVQVVE